MKKNKHSLKISRSYFGETTLDGYPIATYSNDELNILKNLLERVLCEVNGYTGEISAVFYHLFPNMPRYKVGDKIVQFHLETSDNIMFFKTDELCKTERGDNGYGSSDKK